MNYIAHLFLSRNHPDLVLGNFLTDMMTIAEIDQWPEVLQRGVHLHHHIDAFTDKHHENRLARQMLRPYFRKYSGVALDLFYDYIFYQNWDTYSVRTFLSFSAGQYEMIQGQGQYIPQRLQSDVGKMIDGDFLHRFTTYSGQSYSFASLDRRASFHTGFDRAIEVLENHLDDLTNSFNLFFPDLIDEIDDFQSTCGTLFNFPY